MFVESFFWLIFLCIYFSIFSIGGFHLSRLLDLALDRAYIIIQTRLELKPYHSDANVYTNMTPPQLIRRGKSRNEKINEEKK